MYHSYEDLDVWQKSCAELRTQLHIGQRVSLIEAWMADKIIREAKNVSRMLHGLVKSFNKDLQPKRSAP